MTKSRVPFLRGLTVQLFAITVLPLTLLLLLIAFGSVSLHQKDMRALVGERDERAVRSAAAALGSELHHRAANIADLAGLAVLSHDTVSIRTTDDLNADFDGGLAYLDMDRQIITSTRQTELWNWVAQNKVRLASLSDPDPVFSAPFLASNSNKFFVIISQMIPSRNMIIAGAFSPETLAQSTLSTSYPVSTHVTIFLLDPSNQVLYSNGPLAKIKSCPNILVYLKPCAEKVEQRISGKVRLNTLLHTVLLNLQAGRW